MHLTLHTLVSSVLIALLPTLVTATVTIAPPIASISSSCVTVTSTNGGSCPTPTPCVMAACLLLSTVTLRCGCPSIYTERVCASTCPLGCGTAYQTLYIPCATSFSGTISGSSTLTSSTPTPSNISTETGSVTSGSATTPTGTWNGTETIIWTQTIPINTTTVVVTSSMVITISSCPAKVTCHGQTSTWTGAEGPYTCKETKTCSCVLPGGGNATLTGTGTVSSSSGPVIATTPGKGTSTTPASGSTSSAVVVQANGAGRETGRGWAEGWMVGVFGLFLGAL